MNKKGFALSIVLWIVAALLLGIAYITSLSKNNLILTKKLQDKLSKRLKAESILEVLKFAIMTSDYDSTSLIITENLPYKLPERLVMDGTMYQIDKDTNISLKDASSMLSSIYPDAKTISLLSTSNNQALSYIIENSIRDWVDKDDNARLGGAEKSFYKFKKHSFYQPRNSPALQSIYEFRLINGLDNLKTKTWNKLKNYLYGGRATAINFALIDENFLSKILHLNPIEAQALENYKKNNFKKYIDFIEHSEYFDENYMGFALSFKIKIGIMVSDRQAASKIDAFIDFRSLSTNSISVNQYEIY